MVARVNLGKPYGFKYTGGTTCLDVWFFMWLHFYSFPPFSLMQGFILVDLPGSNSSTSGRIHLLYMDMFINMLFLTEKSPNFYFHLSRVQKYNLSLLPLSRLPALFYSDWL